MYENYVSNIVFNNKNENTVKKKRLSFNEESSYIMDSS